MIVPGPVVSPTAGDAAPLLRVRGLRVYFPVLRGAVIRRRVGDLKAVDEVSIDVGHGETVGLVGESGCGKSTFGRALLGLVRPTAGSISFDGTELVGLEAAAMRRMRRRIQMIFQDSYASLSPRMRVADIIAEPVDIHRLAQGARRSERIDEVMRLVGLDPALASRYAHEFSGGQRQRINIARALAPEPDFVVCDEPVSSLDVSIQAQIVNLLESLQRRLGLAFLFISHDLAVVRHICRRVAVMYLGRMVEIADRERLYTRPLHPYTRALLSAVPVPDPGREAERSARRIVLEGDLPSPASPPPGCRFCTRCRSTGEVKSRYGIDCTLVAPALAETEPGHAVACHLYEGSHPDTRAGGAGGG